MSAESVRTKRGMLTSGNPSDGTLRITISVVTA
jgi:hypothetical protein